jgi:hypothetical protein
MPNIDLDAIKAMQPATPSTPAPQTTKPNKWGPKPGVFTFYRLKQMAEVEPGKFNYEITKFDMDLNVESQYAMIFIPSNNGGYYDCNCPGAAKRFDCRHKAIQKAIVDAGEVNSGRFYCFETKTFKRPEEVGR